MAQYIDKSDLVTEIEKHKAIWDGMDSDYCKGQRLAYSDILSFLNTLEVKEVDLEKELETWRHNHFHGRRDKEASGEYLERVSQLNLAKHFFVLGLKTQKGKLYMEKYNKNDNTWVVDYWFYPEQGYCVTNKKKNEYR